MAPLRRPLGATGLGQTGLNGHCIIATVITFGAAVLLDVQQLIRKGHRVTEKLIVDREIKAMPAGARDLANDSIGSRIDKRFCPWAYHVRK